jgi:hypothetical protein
LPKAAGVAVLKDGQSRPGCSSNRMTNRQASCFDAEVPVLAGFQKAMGFVF